MAEKTLQATTSSTSYSFKTAANFSDLTAPVNSDIIHHAGAGNVDTGLNNTSLTGLTLMYPMSFIGTVGVADASSTNASVTLAATASTTVTVTHTAHGYANTTGQAVVISGSTVAACNGIFEITYVDANSYTYTTSSVTVNETARSRKLDELYVSGSSTTAMTCKIGDASGSATAGAGSGRLKLNFGTGNVACTVVNTASSSTDSYKEPVRMVVNNSSARFTIQGGRVGIGTGRADWLYPGTSVAATVGEVACVGSNAIVNVGRNVTLTTFRQNAGTATLYSAPTTITQDGGTLTLSLPTNSGTVTTANVAGVAYLNGGTITTLNVRPGGHADLRNSNIARTITTVNLYESAILSYDPEIVTVTNPINLVNTEPGKVTINVPKGCTLAIASA